MSPLGKTLLYLGAVIAGLAVFGKNPGDRAEVGDTVDAKVHDVIVDDADLARLFRSVGQAVDGLTIRLTRAISTNMFAGDVVGVIAQADGSRAEVRIDPPVEVIVRRAAIEHVVRSS